MSVKTRQFKRQYLGSDPISEEVSCEYEKQAREFLRDTSSDLLIVYKGVSVFPWAIKHWLEHKVDVFQCQLSKADGKYTYSFKFYNSISASKAIMPSLDAYSALSSLGNSLDISNDIDEFQNKFGYKRASTCIRAFRATRKENKALRSMYSESELDLLSAIRKRIKYYDSTSAHTHISPLYTQ